MKKKIVLLGAMQMHLPLIERAHERGIDVVTVDWTKENPGHSLASAAYFDSTTDAEAVERIVRREKADGVLTFNSDPAALTAAVVAERLNLPGSGSRAVEIMSEKDKFRQFLSDNGVNVTRFGSYSDFESLSRDLERYQLPVMIKPVDSSGSKGVVRVNSFEDLKTAFDVALKLSRGGRVIIEEFIEAAGPQLHGDGFVAEGELQFLSLGDHHFDSSINNLVPVSTTFPSVHTQSEIKAVEEEVRRFIRAVGFRQGGINVEARISARDGKPYLIEIGARNGGNFTPIIIGKATGFDFIDAALDAALGLPFRPQNVKAPEPTAYLIMHSPKEDVLSDISLSPRLKSLLFDRFDYLKPGDEVKTFKGANVAIGVLLVSFPDVATMLEIADGMEHEITITLK